MTGGEPGPGHGRKRSGVGALWVLLAPLACCAGPLLVAGLGVAGALAWGGLGLVAAVVAVAVVMIIRSRRRRCGRP
jgi:hypothetical protein